MQGASSENSGIPVGKLIIAKDKVDTSKKVNDVSDIFHRMPNIDAMAVVENCEPFGLITRNKLFFTLSKRYGNELYGRHPIAIIADPAPLIVNENDLIEDVVEKAFSRTPENVYDEIIVTDTERNYLGLLSVKQLVIEQGNALARSQLLEEVATARAKELERINHLKSKFISTVTHELRSPVNAIIGLAELLRMAADSGAIEDVQERLQLMISTASHLRSIITNILDLSKIESGKIEVEHQLVDVVSLISDIHETTKVLVGQKPVSVNFNMPDEPIMISTDMIKLKQILTNLTSNAVKFTDHGSVEISLATLEDGLVINVQDTGIGIKEEDQNHIFSAFGQVEDPFTKSREGTGLGLSISKNLAKLIGGYISVTSTYGKGSTFSLTLPMLHIGENGGYSYAV